MQSSYQVPLYNELNHLKMLLCPSLKVSRQQKHWIANLQFNESLSKVGFLPPGKLLRANIKPSKWSEEAHTLVVPFRFTALSPANAVSQQVTAAGRKKQHQITLEIPFQTSISSSGLQRDDINQSDFKELKEIKVFPLNDSEVLLKGSIAFPVKQTVYIKYSWRGNKKILEVTVGFN